MGQKGRTKDESFLMALYDLANKTGDLQTPFDRYEIGALAAMQRKATDTIIVLLLRTNFVRRGDIEGQVYLTPQGIALVEQLHENR